MHSCKWLRKTLTEAAIGKASMMNLLEVVWDWGFGTSSWPPRALDTRDLRFGDSGKLAFVLGTPGKKKRKNSNWMNLITKEQTRKLRKIELFPSKLTRRWVEETCDSWWSTSLRGDGWMKYWWWGLKNKWKEHKTSKTFQSFFYGFNKCMIT